MNVKKKFVSAAALTLTGAFALAACSGSNSASDGGSTADGGAANVSGTLAGSGASSMEDAQGAFLGGFSSQNPSATVTYDAVGSGTGREQFLAGATQFAGSDAYLSEDELGESSSRCYGGTAFDVPVYISPIAVIYKLDGVDDLQLSPDTLAKIFAGDITAWNDPAIQADNPDATLPDTSIVPVHRSDKSGTTENFTEYLEQAAPTAWTHGAIETWFQDGGQSGDGTSGMVNTVSAGNGTIGYADASKAGSLKSAKVKVGEDYVGYSADAAAKAVEVSPVVEGRAEHDIALELERDTTASGAYPIVLVSYMIMCDTYESAEEADLVKAYASYVISEQGQADAAQAAGSAPLSDSLREKAQASIDAIKAKG
ncbi:MAG: phosphate ABC transporter substrate-binding protein PstS [Dermabacter sp.]|nr:phosphate ABC transporter substrate-binding protein PstS [Dermabacter sp.]